MTPAPQPGAASAAEAPAAALSAVSSRPPSRVRLALALMLYAVALGVLGVGVGACLQGGWTGRLGGMRVSMTSWKVLRLVLVPALVGFLVDPRREERLGRLLALPRRFPRLALGGGLMAAMAYVVWYKVSQHLSFNTGAYDLSMFHHAVHNTVHGRFMHAFGLERNFFSEHFSPLLLALVPPYALFQSPLTLLVAQSLAVAGACVPLYLLARHHELSRTLSSLVALLYLSNAVLWRSHAFDFHIELFAPLAMFLAALAMVKRRWVWFHVACVLALTIKEEMVLLVPALAVLLLFQESARWRHALGTLVLCGVWAVLAWKVVIPASYPVAQAQSHFVERYAHLGSSYSGIVWGLLTRPGWVLGRLFSAPVHHLVQSFGYLPLLDPLVLLLALPALLIHLVSGYGFQAHLGVYYGLGGAVILCLSLPRVLRRLQRRFGARSAGWAAMVALTLSPAARFPYALDERVRQGRELLAGLPEGGTVSAQTALLPHLSPQRPLVLFSGHAQSTDVAEWIVLDPGSGRWPLTHAQYAHRVRGLLSGSQFGVFAHQEGFLVLRRGHDTSRNLEVLQALGPLLDAPPRP